MAYDAINGPKVRFELGEGDAPDVVADCIEMLAEDYTATESLLSSLGFNGPVLDLKPRRAEETVLPKDNEAHLKYIIDNKVSVIPGGCSGAAFLLLVVELFWRQPGELRKRQRTKRNKKKSQKKTQPQSDVGML